MRIGLPREIKNHGYSVGLTDALYQSAGATLAADAAEVPDPEQTLALIKSGAVCIAYETITGPGGGLPLLAPMSEVAGRMAVQAGAVHLEKSKGCMGMLLGGVPGAVVRTSTFALNNATLAHAVALANKGWQQAIRDNPHLKAGLNVALGQVTHEAVAQALDLAFVPAERVLG